jgi:hypothetical protein
MASLRRSDQPHARGAEDIKAKLRKAPGRDAATHLPSLFGAIMRRQHAEWHAQGADNVCCQVYLLAKQLAATEERWRAQAACARAHMYSAADHELCRRVPACAATSGRA